MIMKKVLKYLQDSYFHYIFAVYYKSSTLCFRHSGA